MSDVTLNPYLFFTGNCREAMEFYKSIFGGELNISMNQGEHAENVMHAHLIGGEIVLMASDGTRTEPYPASFITLALGGTDLERLTEIFDKLAEGGTVDHPLAKQFWGAIFGQLTDKFGVDWMVNVTTG